MLLDASLPRSLNMIVIRNLIAQSLTRTRLISRWVVMTFEGWYGLKVMPHNAGFPGPGLQ
ncbi:hypothetical protein AM1_H0023 (plasmid) [Acaryochloris marina MBIC11017]|uniref:Uncharacterized protein n=1 Tax=Acaryochloris marina (strain MBIC 11017) TaxID=329726 RepID=A8ZQU0_ACAM1|nr:hypothetical protein AM1_H0023 [Acaryochloris marina MBIC11017]